MGGKDNPNTNPSSREIDKNELNIEELETVAGGDGEDTNTADCTVINGFECKAT